MKKIRKLDLNKYSKTDEDFQVDEAEFNKLYEEYKTRTRNEDNSIRLYIIFCFIRILLTIFPQTGYIHPDELIQSVEVVGGTILNADVDLPWEYNRTNPVRSVTIPYLVNGIPIWCLKQTNRLFEYLFEIDIISPYTILVFTRFSLCVASFFVDYSVYEICRVYSRPYHAKLTILSTSYVMLVFSTRTFSNTVEMTLFSVLLCMIATCMFDHQLLVKFRKQFVRISNGLRTPRDRVKHLKILKVIEDHSLQHCFLISCLVVLGCFNRPTFFIFGIGPIFFWIHRGLSSEFITVKDIHTRMFMFLISAIPLILIFICIDSSYFGYLTIAELLNLDISIENFVFPLWNFVKYNVNPENLAKHGIHPKYVHILVNLPLLFGGLALIMWKSVFLTTLKFVERPVLQGYSRALDIDNLMRVGLIVPLVILSIFSHQEPRFIIPVIVPLIFLYGDKIYDIKSDTPFANTFFKLWIIFNVIMTYMFGFVHQSGVYHLSTFLHHEIQNAPQNLTFHIVTSHMYSYPRVLLNQPNPNILFKAKSGVYYQKKRRVYYYELQSGSVERVVDKVNDLIKLNNITTETTGTTGTASPQKLFICLPTLLSNDFEQKINKTIKIPLNYITYLFPHLSTELIDKPEIWDLAKYQTLHYKFLKIFSKLENFLSLNIYSISFYL